MIFAYQVKGVSSAKKVFIVRIKKNNIKCEKIISNILDIIFDKIEIFAYLFFVIDGKIIG